MAPTAAQTLAQFAREQHQYGLSRHLRMAVSNSVLDTVGNAVAALDQPPARVVADLVSRWGGSQESYAFGLPQRVPAPAAAFLNGTLAHSLDFDDTHFRSILHPSASVVPAALAIADFVDSPGNEFLDAVAIGLEVVCRLGLAGNDPVSGNNAYFDRGLHATSICGAIGAAVAGGVLLGLDEEGLTSAIGIAASMGAGLLEANRTGGSIKRAHCGWAAHSGVTAAFLAQTGLTGPPTVLEGRFGFLTAYCGDSWDLDALVNDLGREWVIREIAFKPYPCNGFTHAGIDAALLLREKGVRPSDIEGLTLGVASPLLRTIAEPRTDKVRPSSGYHAAFSGPFTVASALIGGGGLGLGHEDFTDLMAADPERLGLAARVDCIADPESEADYPRLMSAVLTARLRDGRVVTERVRSSLGTPDNPLSSEQLEAKFLMNARLSMTEPDAAHVADAAKNLNAQTSPRDLIHSIELALAPRGHL